MCERSAVCVWCREYAISELMTWGALSGVCCVGDAAGVGEVEVSVPCSERLCGGSNVGAKGGGSTKEAVWYNISSASRARASGASRVASGRARRRALLLAYGGGEWQELAGAEGRVRVCSGVAVCPVCVTVVRAE